jgi:PfaD family protein
MSSVTFTAERPSLRRDPASIADAVARFRTPAAIVADDDVHAVCLADDPGYAAVRATAVLPALYPEWLGDRGFLDAHHVRFPYVVGEMARGIATVEMTAAAARGGMLGFFGAAGLGLPEVTRAVDRLAGVLGPEGHSWGVNLIHSPDDPQFEDALVDLFLARDVRRVSASAFMALAPAVVRFAARGLQQDAQGGIVRRNHVFAKVSRAEVAAAFIAPPPPALLAALVAAGRLTQAEADLAARISVATEITAEADSGGHTDNRPLTVLLPQIIALRDRLVREHGLSDAPRVGAAGGIGTPAAVAAAFGMGAAYVLTGSVNQAAVESGLSALGRELLADAASTDVTMAPSADMFEMGVKVQVLRKGLFFPMRAARLYELYRSYESLDAIPTPVRAQLEAEIFRQPLTRIWDKTQAFFAERDPSQLERAARDARHRMALVFRWYLGNSSRWPLDGAADRKADFQIWCGPAMGAFNDWTRGSFLAAPSARSVVQIGLNLMEGAAAVVRAQQFRAAGVDVPASCFAPVPMPLAIA